MSIDYRRLLLDMFQAALNVAAPAVCVPAHLPPRAEGPYDRCRRAEYIINMLGFELR
jgi:hypothetical protein